MTGEVPLGLLGAGRIAQLIHVPALAGVPEARITAVLEPDAANAAACRALLPDATQHASLEALLAAGVRGVVVCSPSWLHAEQAQAALAAGCGVYLEKPVALDAAAGRAVADAEAASDAVAMAGFMLRRSPSLLRARELLAAGAIGELLGGQSVFTGAGADGAAWRRDPRAGGGALLDLLSHHADAWPWLLRADVTAVAAQVRSVRHPEDTATVQLTLAGGLHVGAVLSTSAAEHHHFTVLGTRGQLVVDPWRDVRVERGSGGRLRGLRARAWPRRADFQRPFRDALAAFVAGVRTGAPPTPSLQDGLRSLEIVLAARRAAETGERVAP